MSNSSAFHHNSVIYDSWFERKQHIYASEVKAVQSFLKPRQHGIEVGVEIGVGTGRFASALGIRQGVEPSEHMAEIARGRGIDVVHGFAENLPLQSNQFDFVLMVTAICFFDDVEKAFKEAARVLKKDGYVLAAFIDKESELGKLYKERSKNNVFYKDATFYSVPQIVEMLKLSGFDGFEYRQTLFNVDNVPHEVKDGYGTGSFVVIKANLQNL